MWLLLNVQDVSVVTVSTSEMRWTGRVRSSVKRMTKRTDVITGLVQQQQSDNIPA